MQNGCGFAFAYKLIKWQVVIKTENFVFEKVHARNVEDLRIMRNSATVQKYLVHKGEISAIQQIEWFKREDSLSNHYFLAKRNNSLIGYCLLRNIEFTNLSAEPGTFIANEDLFDSSAAALYMITFMDICRFLFGIKIFYGNVLSSNYRAMSNYEWFAATTKKGDREGEVVLTENESQSYEQSTNKIRKALKTLYGYEFGITIVLDRLLDSEESISFFADLVDKLPVGTRNKVKFEIQN